MSKMLKLEKIVHKRTSNGRIDNGKYEGTDLIVFFPQRLLEKAVIEEKNFKGFGKGYKVTFEGESWRVKPNDVLERLTSD